VSNDGVQGPQDAHYIVDNLHPKALMIVDDQESYSTGLVAEMLPVFKAAGIKVDHESVSQKTNDFSSLVAKVTPSTSVVVLPWQVAANAQQFGRNLAAQHKKAVIFGTDGLFSPGTFSINGSYVSAFGQGDRGRGEGEVRELRHVRPAGVRGDPRRRRGDCLGLQVGPDPEPGQRAGRDQGHG
jgi:branched-chain amino acid transport system substrate-binding protein